MSAEAPVGFQCSRCGKCCKNLHSEWKVFVNFEDVQVLARHLDMEVEAVVAAYCADESFDLGDEHVEIFSLKPVDGRCVFLREDDLCGVHEAKPAQCRFGPFGFFWEGRRHYDCMLDVDVPADWNSDCNDANFVNGLRRHKRGVRAGDIGTPTE